jgi:predicted nuclease of restriction endonuclease-like (RecB) superfamily
MKKASVFILALLVLLQPLSKTWIFVSFQLNQDFIASVLCINRDIPVNTCQGKCYLKKRLKETHQDEQKQANAREKSPFEILISHQPSVFQFLSVQDRIIENTPNNVQSHTYISRFISDIFHPPRYV